MNTRRTSSFVLAALLIFLGATNINAAPGLCSTATPKGSFGFLEQGTLLHSVPGIPLPPPVPYANVGIVTLDGAGHVSGTYTASFGGAIVPGTISGSYTVNPDCTYSLQFTPAPFPEVLHHAGTISGNGMTQEDHYVYTDATLVASGVGKKNTIRTVFDADIQGFLYSIRTGDRCLCSDSRLAPRATLPDGSCRNNHC